MSADSDSVTRKIPDGALRAAEWIGGPLGLVAAAMVAFKQPWSKYAYLLFIIGGVLLLIFCSAKRHYGLVLQQAGFLIINLIGAYCWLLSSCNDPVMVIASVFGATP